jgi:DNA-binding transcriptional regulator YdaS (Cro superfamily)
VVTEKVALALVRRAVDKAGGQAHFARELGVSRAYVNDVYHGRRSLGPKVLEHVGLKAVTVTNYEWVQK